MKRPTSRLIVGLVIALGLLALSIMGGSQSMNAQEKIFTLSMIVRGTDVKREGAINTIQLAQGGVLTMILTIQNITSDKSNFAVFLQIAKGVPTTATSFDDLLAPDIDLAPGVQRDVTCAFGDTASGTQSPQEPKATDDCSKSKNLLLGGKQSQIVIVQLDTSTRTAIKRGADDNDSTFTVRADIVDPGNRNNSLTANGSQKQAIIVTPSAAKLKLQGPIELSPPAPSQGSSLPTLSVLLANTGKGAFLDKTAVFFSLFQTAKPTQPAADFTLLIVEAKACEVDLNGLQSQKTQTTCQNFPDRQVVFGSIREGLIQQLSITFSTEILEPGSYKIFGCLKKFETAKRFCDPTDIDNKEDKDKRDSTQLDDFTLNFQISPPDGIILLSIAPESERQIEQGKNFKLTLTVTNLTGVFLRSVGFSFALTPPANSNEIQCDELSSNSSPKKGTQCVLQNLGTTNIRKFRVELPTSQYKVGQSVSINITGSLLGATVVPLNVLVSPDGFPRFFPVIAPVEQKPGTPPSPSPELHPLSLEFTPTSPVTQGQTVLIRSRIENSGSQFTGSFTVDFQIFKVDSTSGTIKFVAALGETRHFPGIDPSVTIEASTLLDTCARDASGKCTLELGTYIVKVVVSTVPNELDRTNNELSTLLTIQAPKK
ncbi:hypothetical protein HYR54_12070 [Candidatus Acetothermia bacterium]|nr:hypothetical protein [Candidatus Acetothermia bacterium]